MKYVFEIADNINQRVVDAICRNNGYPFEAWGIVLIDGSTSIPAPKTDVEAKSRIAFASEKWRAWAITQVKDVEIPAVKETAELTKSNEISTTIKITDTSDKVDVVK